MTLTSDKAKTNKRGTEKNILERILSYYLIPCQKLINRPVFYMETGLAFFVKKITSEILCTPY